MSTPLDAYASPVAYAPEHARADFLRRVAGLTLVGLGVAAVAATMMAAAILLVPGLLGNRIASLVFMLGGIFVANSVARRMVWGTAKIPGLVLGAAAEGMALGYILLMAAFVGMDAYGGVEGAFAIIGQAGVLTGITCATMIAYLWSAPKDLSLIRAGMAVLGIPMLILMVVSFVFPIGGVFGLLLSAAFVVFSGAGLLYTLNQVLHQMSTQQHVEAAYEMTLGLLVLFWNILVLLMRLQGRD